ncbi:restriction endonuclease subunit S [Phocoenobacter atlanticus]|uniref:restriction endonuclease subunit S n=1 Tax=Phocoenobacter atlanticus TaxID=3416742 RepID=UPI00278C52D1|nr:restriction endonuclease subunit S [Pasteurella atlantica]
MNAPLNKILESVEWGEFEVQNLFNVVGTRSLDSNAIEFTETGINFVGRTFENNGIQGKIQERNFKPNEPFTITATVIGNYKYVKYQKDPYYCSQNINKLTPKEIIEKWNERIAYFFISNLQKFVSLYDGQQGGYKLDDIKQFKITLPITSNGSINFSFMEKFIAELEASHLAELEAYLSVTNLKDYHLTQEEKDVLRSFEQNEIEWGEFNLEKLFGKSTRGRRLKSDDRIKGTLPFVTAGEANTGISDFIGNDVHIFSENTTTIDMFGSAKYRNYKYGGDDHIAVVHTENLQKHSSIFVTTAIHKSSYTNKFSYSRNFYAKDADELNIQLPLLDNEPNYQIMEIFIKAIQKLVIKDVVLYSEQKRALTKQVISS